MKEHQLFFNKSIESWDEGIPLGNGRIGTLIWGTPKEFRFSLDRVDIWDHSTPQNIECEEFTYGTLIQLAREGKTEEIRELFDAPYNSPLPTKLPVGKIIFSFPKGKNITSRLEMKTACSEFEVEGSGISLEAFCHATTKSGFIRIRGKEREYETCLLSPGFSCDRSKTGKVEKITRDFTKGTAKDLYYPPLQEGKEEGEISFQWFLQPIESDFYFGILMGKKREDKETTICYKIFTSKDGEDPLEEAKLEIKKELNCSYERMRKEHQDWWDKFWEKSSLSLPDELFEHNWYITNYLLGSCSRKGEYPMPLQGVWTADNHELPPWKGDYHNDLNTQISYTHYLKANHWEEGETFLDYLWNLRPQAKKFAKTFYKTKGICLPGVMTIDGKPLGGWPMYSLVPTHQIWLCQCFDQYYRYSGDKLFLENRAKKYFEETAHCILGLLEEREGKYYLPISSSPEIHDDEIESFVEPNSNYDLALLFYLFTTLKEYSYILQDGRQEEWERHIKKLPSLAVNEEKILMISPTENLKESHRHLSNAMAIWPLKLYDYQREKEIIDATILDYERWGSGMWVGFSFCWMSHLYSVAENGEGAYEQLRIFWESFCSPNGFHLNGDYKKRGYSTFHYRPFTLESNMWAADALQEMLLKTEQEEITVLPAIPEHWREKSISFKGFKAYGNLNVSLEYDGQKEYKVILMSTYDRELVVKNTEGDCKKIRLRANQEENIFLKRKAEID